MHYPETADISVNDVYKLAQDIAEEFDLVAQRHGIDNVRSLVEKVIDVLEMLESTVKMIEHLEMKLSDVLSTNSHLSRSKNVMDLDKSKLKQSFEEAEESWLQELMTLKTQISSLKAENEFLKRDHSVEKENPAPSDETSINVDQENAILSFQHSLKQKNSQLQDLTCNLNALNHKVEELVKKNKILHIENRDMKNSISRFIMEKNDCKRELILLKRDNALLTENISELVHCTSSRQKSNEICLDSESYSTYSCEESLRKDVRQHIKIEMKLLENIKKLQYELQFEKCKSQKFEDELLKRSVAGTKRSFSHSNIQQLFHLFLGLN